MAINLNGEGYAMGTLDELAQCVQTSRSHVNKGLLVLVKYNLISKKKRGEYWINPALFRPAYMEM
ncbi:replication/maintenance protein RepL [Larkinella soli]|uniref:replication/maintenance protein RepL n=1 Tax=Larkinella soli TaxID=1770527 RepID=UPI0013E3CDCD|nr:replication/maintenance protein RepL [Larkinella soli]